MISLFPKFVCSLSHMVIARKSGSHRVIVEAGTGLTIKNSLTAVVMAVAAMVVTAPVMVVIPAIAALVVWNVHLVVPAVLNKIDTFTAGIVLTAMFAPVPCVAWRHVQVDRISWRHPHNQTRLAIEQTRPRSIANIDASVKIRLADADGDINIGSKCRGSYSGQCCCDQ